MKIGFICPTVPGHLNPMTALARHLQARNHEATSSIRAGAGGRMLDWLKCRVSGSSPAVCLRNCDRNSYSFF